jgi:DNA-binding winged helix-turn-helix (wHTH) protein
VPTGTSFAGYQFEDCRLDLDRGCLVLHDTEHRLRYQTFQVLLYFAQHPGTLVTKEDLIAAVWKQSFVSSNALVQCIAELRRILDDDPRSPRFIKTLPRVGYLFLPHIPSECRHLREHSFRYGCSKSVIGQSCGSSRAYRSV